jgi:hypothetical protein
VYDEQFSRRQIGIAARQEQHRRRTKNMTQSEVVILSGVRMRSEIMAVV